MTQENKKAEKVLVLQLARLGDVYQTLPALKALRRDRPQTEIHLLTRKKFAAAAQLVHLTIGAQSCVDHFWELDTRHVLAPLIADEPQIEKSLESLSDFCSTLREQGYTEIINLSFSPFSSFLTYDLSVGHSAKVRGYTRFADGYLNIPDDGSAYVYGQVGVGRHNQLHLADLFAHITGSYLVDKDWESFACSQPSVSAQREILIHIGASDFKKTLSSEQWGEIIENLLSSAELNSCQFALIGSQDESGIADEVVQFVSTKCGGPVAKRLLNLVGQTSLDELFSRISGAELVIGGDSAPVHMASLAGIPVLNFSLPTVSCYETGPKSRTSRMLRVANASEITGTRVAFEVNSILHGSEFIGTDTLLVKSPTAPYVTSYKKPTFEWQLVEALYMGQVFPPAPDELFSMGMLRLSEANNLAIEQFEHLRKRSDNSTALLILSRVDEMLSHIERFVPTAAPLIRWFVTEKSRLGPQSPKELLAATETLHRRLEDILALYISKPEELNFLGALDDDLVME